MRTDDFKKAMDLFCREVVNPRPHLHIRAQSNKALSLTADGLSNRKYEVHAKITGEDLEIACNRDFFSQAAEGLRGPAVTIECNGPTGAIAIRAENFLYVLMPVAP